MKDRKEYKRQYYLDNKEKHKAWNQKWYNENKDRAKELEYLWRKENPEKFKERIKTWRKANPEKVRSYNLKAKYGISLEDFDNLFLKQNESCAICKTKEIPSKGWHVDHDHTTSKVRGILCQHCNLLLGYSKDNTKILTSAITYLGEN